MTREIGHFIVQEWRIPTDHAFIGSIVGKLTRSHQGP